MGKIFLITSRFIMLAHNESKTVFAHVGELNYRTNVSKPDSVYKSFREKSPYSHIFVHLSAATVHTRLIQSIQKDIYCTKHKCKFHSR